MIETPKPILVPEPVVAGFRSDGQIKPRDSGEKYGRVREVVLEWVPIVLDSSGFERHVILLVLV